MTRVIYRDSKPRYSIEKGFEAPELVSCIGIGELQCAFRRDIAVFLLANTSIYR